MFVKHDGKSLSCLKQTVHAASEDSEGSEERGKKNIYHLREYLNHQEETVGRNTDIKVTGGEDRSK